MKMLAALTAVLCALSLTSASATAGAAPRSTLTEAGDEADPALDDPGADDPVAPPTQVVSTRLHVIQFNACDQWHVVKHPDARCKNTAPTDRGIAIANIMRGFGADVASFQEICRSTADVIRANLGSIWKYYFQPTYPLPSADTRCGSAGSSTVWGQAVFTRGASFSSPVNINLDDNGATGDNKLLCGNTTIVVGFRVCTVHPKANNDPVTRQQILQAGDQAAYWANNRQATIVGADMNAHVTACPFAGTLTAERELAKTLGVFYRNRFGPSFGGDPAAQCATNRGSYYEADEPTPSDDGDNEPTFSSGRKLDYIFFNAQRFWTDFGGDAVSTSVSDHSALKGAMTVHS
jgi:hypothetical protein